VLDAAVVGRELCHPERLALARPQHDVHPLRRRALDQLDELGVEAQLQQEVRLHAPGELRVRHLVAEIAQRRRSLDPVQKVAVPAPARAVEQHALVDHLGARLHRRDGFSRARARALQARLALDLHHLPAFLDELRQVALLVLVALPCDQFRRVGPGL
jgi:hypothetical protein